MKNKESFRAGSSNHLGPPLRRTSKGILIATIALWVAGCMHFLGPGPSRVASADQAGSVRVAATTVSLWADVSAAMKPNFSLTGDQAVAQVLPTTETIDQQIYTALGAGIALGFPQTTASSSAGTTNNQQSSSSTAGGATTTTATTSDGSSLSTTKATQSGTAPALPTGMPGGGALPPVAGSLPPLGIDPKLKYDAAINLLQSVQLLNQMVANAADRKCFVPYVIGLKVAFMNYRPHLAYSLHEHIGFFFKSRISNDKLQESGDADFEEGPAPPVPSKELSVSCLQSDVVPEVIPLLVTDDIQVAVKAHAAEAAKQITSALSFMTHGIGVGANLNAVKQTLESIQNHDLTSSLTVGRDTGSSIYVEVAANNTATGDPSLVNQTYDIPVLLLVPRSYFGGVHDAAPVQISVTTFQQFRDAGSGVILAGRPSATFVQQGSSIIESYLQAQADRDAWRRLNDSRKEFWIRSLYNPAASGTMLGLIKALNSFTSIDGAPCSSSGAGTTVVPCIDFHQAPSIWTALGTLGDDANRSNFVVQLPLPAPITVPSQQILLSDDGENPIKAVLSGVGGRSITDLAAQLRLTPFESTEGPFREADVSAQALTLDPAAHTLTLSFPSLKKLGIGCLAPTESEPAPKAAPKGDKTKEAGKCPSRASGAGSRERPNRIVLSLVGCNPASQLCPALTATDLEPVTSDKAKPSPSAIGVTLVPAAATAKVKVAGGGSSICVQEGGAGKVYLTINGTPPGDSGALTVDGAAVTSTLDSNTNALMPHGKNGYAFAKDGIFTIGLANVAANSAINISVQAYTGTTADGGAAKLTYSVATNCSPIKLAQH